MTNSMGLAWPLAIAAALAVPQAVAAKEEVKAPELVRCEAPIGSVALVEGDQAGWSNWGLGSPRSLIAALALESGCFTVDNPADATPAQFLVTLIAGSQEEVDKGMELAKGAATEALVRSGAAGSVLRGVPMGGAVLGMFGGLGGKKKTYAAGLRVVSPANGLTVAAGQGVVRRSSISFAGGGWASGAANAAGYGASKDGQMLTEAFVIAFNALVAQRQLMEGAAEPAAAAAAPAGASVAVDTVMRAAATREGAVVRNLRVGTSLTPTGRREGLFVEVKDSFGTTGWVSVEDLR
ncbi:SH3 domain-containing protein [Erythrobacter sp. NE805]|uniref:SH3 domain-containing protein n=1 Tax=Erythrobacter sp. NE805 TaxID=3389875 RepID=UPI00396B0C54